MKLFELDDGGAFIVERCGYCPNREICTYPAPAFDARPHSDCPLPDEDDDQEGGAS